MEFWYVQFNERDAYPPTPPHPPTYSAHTDPPKPIRLILTPPKPTRLILNPPPSLRLTLPPLSRGIRSTNWEGTGGGGRREWH